MREGKKDLCRRLLEKTFELIKRIQIERYHKASPDKRDQIILDPKIVLYKAVENAKPVLELTISRKGGQNYQVCFFLNS